MDGALARGSDVVASHRGKIVQYAGDSLLAVSGAEEAHEDDAERELSRASRDREGLERQAARESPEAR